MANTYKVLGQSAPSATSETNIYTVPAATQAVVSTIFIANRGTSGGTFRIAVRPSGASIANQHYIAYNVPLEANSMLSITAGITMATTDVITVYASTSNFSFNVYGSEIA